MRFFDVQYVFIELANYNRNGFCFFGKEHQPNVLVTEIFTSDVIYHSFIKAGSL